MRRLALVTVALVALLAPAAHAQQTNAPPGNAGIDEYLETVPSADGDRPPQDVGGGADDAGGGGGLTAGQRDALTAQGGAGEQAAAVLDATSDRPKSGVGGGELGSGETSGSVLAGKGQSPFEAFLAVAGGDAGSAGMGALLPLLIIGSLGVAIGVAVARRRGSSS